MSPPPRSPRPSRRELEKLGKRWLRYIREEAARDRARSPTLPRTESFLGSFHFRVVDGALELTSDWPWFELLFEGTGGPFKMRWLTRAAGVARVPIRRSDGTVVFRATPLTTAEAWVHPGVARHTFVQRAYERAFEESVAEMVARVIEENFSE